jgi:hypothetical protein
MDYVLVAGAISLSAQARKVLYETIEVRPIHEYRVIITY